MRTPLPRARRAGALLIGICVGIMLAGVSLAGPPKRSEPARRSAPAPRRTGRAEGGASRERGATAHTGRMTGRGGRTTGTRRMGGSHGPFAGRPAARGSHVRVAANGAAVRTRRDGSVSDIHDPKRGMDIHHGLDGSRRVSVERADHTRIVAERGGRGYVQHPYMFRGHEMGHRTYFVHGRVYDRFYGRYAWHGRYLDVYAPVLYYPYPYYAYVWSPWPAPVVYVWTPAPWYPVYGYYYAPAPVYPAPDFWLADAVIGASLAAAYEAGEMGAQVAPKPGDSLVAFSEALLDGLISPAEAAATQTLTPAVKKQVADELNLLVKQEGSAAQANAAGQDVDPSSANIVQLFSDGRAHVFVSGASVDVVSVAGEECAITAGDVLHVSSLGSGDTTYATVLAAKTGHHECATDGTVTVAVSDLQDMYNHMRESLDDSLATLRKQGGTGSLPAAPSSAAGQPTQAAFAAGAPPPDASAGSEIAQEAAQANAAEAEAEQNVAAPQGGNGGGGSGGETTISLGETIARVTAALGPPKTILDLGRKKTYVYPDMRIIFVRGRVADVK